MERDDLASLAGFFCADQRLAPGTTVALGQEAAHHARVRRLEPGERVFVADGIGGRGIGRVVQLTKRDLEIVLDDVRRGPHLPEIHMLVPIADRDRMLWCAEKCAELGAASWTPILWNRSRSVSPRGEGTAFRDRVRARMRSALVQSHGWWLPHVCDDTAIDSALANAPSSGTRLVLDACGQPIGRESLTAPVTVAVGPEGGIESDELERFRAARFRPVSLGANVLRFETAAVAALAIVRAALGDSQENANG